MKRINKKKEQIEQELKHIQKVSREKALARLVWPFIQKDLTIYDAQTALSALSGFIALEVEKKVAEIQVRDLLISLENEKDSPVKKAIIDLIGLLQPEKAKDTASFLDRFSKTLGMYSANVYMKNKMDVLQEKDIIA